MSYSISELVSQASNILAGSVMHRGLSLIAMILVARVLEAEDYGVVTYLTTICLTLAPLISVGVPQVVIREISKSQDVVEARDVFAAASALLFISLLFFFPCYVLFASLWPDVLRISGEYIVTSYVLAASIFFHAVFVSLFTATGNTKTLALVQTFQGAISIPLYFYAAENFGVIGVLSAIGSANLVSIFIFSVFARKYIFLGKFWRRNSLKNAREMLTKSLPIGLNDAAFSLLNLVFVSLIIRGTSDAQLALFMAATQWQMIVVFIPTALSGLVLRYLSMDSAKGDDSSSFFWLSMLVQLCYGLVLVALIAIFDDMIAGLYGDSFSGLSELLVLAVACAIPMISLNLIYQVGVASEQVKVVTGARVGAQVLSLLLLVVVFGDEPTAMSALVAKMCAYGAIALTFTLLLLKRGLKQR